jgi:outer membrane PBP1 activator LpoA protein
VADGAEFVVGPLLKSSFTELANDILVPVPVLTLNNLSDDTLAPPGLYQFSLAPEDEAMSAAQRALSDGYGRGVALVPNNDWGRRLLTSFTTEFEGLGGTLLDYRTYTPGKQDFSNEIENLMGLTGSVNRYQRLRANRRRRWPPAQGAAQVSLLGRYSRVLDVVGQCVRWSLQRRPERHHVCRYAVDH